MSEPFYCWADKLLQLLYSELGEDFTLVFIGRREEAAIISVLAQEFPHCLKCETASPQINMSLQERMVELSRMLKAKSIRQIAPMHIGVSFFIPENEYDSIGRLIDQLEVKNQYCIVDFSKIIQNRLSTTCGDDVSIFIFDDIDSFRQTQHLSSRCKYLFVLIRGNASGFISLIGNQYLFGFTEQTFFDVVFNCLMLFPLAECFSEYARNLMRSLDSDADVLQIRALLAEKPVVTVKAQSEIELGRSVPLEVSVFPGGYTTPALSFEYQMPGIVECSQQHVYGKAEGSVAVLCFERGEVEPVAELNFIVKKRNRVEKIMLSDYELGLGVGDRHRLEMRVYPEDADNLSCLKWYSDNDSVASVNQSGVVTASGRGDCKIYCAAEKAFSVCLVKSKPYAESISLSEVCSADTIQMCAGETIDMAIRVEPADAHDGNLKISSTNYLVANVRDGVITAVEDGEADIYIKSTGGRISKKIHVLVGSHKSDTKKKQRRFFGFFKK